MCLLGQRDFLSFFFLSFFLSILFWKDWVYKTHSKDWVPRAAEWLVDSAWLQHCMRNEKYQTNNLRKSLNFLAENKEISKGAREEILHAIEVFLKETKRLFWKIKLREKKNENWKKTKKTTKTSINYILHIK